jgi:hypothetical protein
MTVIEIPDDQAAALKAKAAAQGLTLKAWLARLAQEETSAQRKPKKSARGLLGQIRAGPFSRRNRPEPAGDLPRFR